MMRKIQFITHSTDRFSYVEGALSALKGGCRWIQLRMKDACMDDIIHAVKEIQLLCRQYNARFIIDDHVELVKSIGADGVHLGKNDMSIAEARPILGLDGYKDILSKMKQQGVNIPIVAIGGIRYDDIIPLMGIGIDGIAVSGSILQTDNPAEEMKRWIDQ